MRAATIRDQEILVEEHPDPVARHGRGARARPRRRAERRRHDAEAGAVSRAARLPPGHARDGVRRGGRLACGPGADRFAIGARVMAIVGGGGQAELAVVHERVLMRVPERLDWPAAGGLPEVFTTAHDALFTQAELQTGERLLVHGGAGGVGTAAIQLGRAAGARVTATVRRASCASRRRARRRGDRREDFAEHGPFDVILELVGAPNLAREPRRRSPPAGGSR